VELTRALRHWKAWDVFESVGVDKFARLIEQNVEQTQFLASLISAGASIGDPGADTDEYRLLPVCRAGVPEEAIERNQRRTPVESQERGIAIPSSTELDGRFCLRVCNVNHRTRREDLVALAEASGVDRRRDRRRSARRGGRFRVDLDVDLLPIMTPPVSSAWL